MNKICLLDIYRYVSYFYTLLIAIIFVFNFGLSIADIVIASKWDTCHLKYVDKFLYSSGSVFLGFIILGSIKLPQYSFLYQLAILSGIGSFAILIWGMIIFYNSQQGDCHDIYYLYGYYRTIVIMFSVVGCIASGLLFVLCAVIYERMTKKPITITIDDLDFIKQLQKHFEPTNQT